MNAYDVVSEALNDKKTSLYKLQVLQDAVYSETEPEVGSLKELIYDLGFLETAESITTLVQVLFNAIVIRYRFKQSYLCLLSDLFGDQANEGIKDKLLLGIREIKKIMKQYVFYTIFNEIKKIPIFSQINDLITEQKKPKKSLFSMESKAGYLHQRTEEFLAIIENDDVSSLQTIVTTPGFNVNMTFSASPLINDVFGFIKKGTNNIEISMIEATIFFGSVKCFKYLISNGAVLEGKSPPRRRFAVRTSCVNEFAIISGNIEIIRLLEQNNYDFKHEIKTAIVFHHYDILTWIIDHSAVDISNHDKYLSFFVESWNIHGLLSLDLSQSYQRCIREAYQHKCTALLECLLKVVDEEIVSSFDSETLNIIILNIHLAKQLDRNRIAQIFNGPSMYYFKGVRFNDIINQIYKINFLFLDKKIFDHSCRKFYNDLIKNMPNSDGIIGKEKLFYQFIYLSIISGKVGMVKTLLSFKGIDVNQDVGDTCFLVAATMKGNLEIIQELLKQPNIDINKRGKYVGMCTSSFEAACTFGYNEIAKLFLSLDSLKIELGIVSLLFLIMVF